ncbi:choice-of-anchor X domain-containing protein [Ramlibacter tataouinensis]|uniref:choice-of-anchor X domain-containing protein n=1 Tax=Ramlibacter tataouinensis TaxID=94132 RepID=UPI000675EB07|nr:choice-of-anchor X domain-containing protein [Ramlibacter tataouinensis]
MRRTLRRRWPAAFAVAAGAALLAWWGHDTQARGSEASLAAAGNAGGASAAAPSPASGASAPEAFGAAARAARAQQRTLWQARYDRAEEVYTRYREATRYPPESRPLAEHPDQVRPFEPVAEDKPLRNAQGRAPGGVRLRTTQERVFLSGGESVRFTVEAVDENGRSLPLVVERAAARSVPDTTALITIVEAPLAFTDDGAGADEAAGDGRYSARLTPQAQGFAQQAGTIRVLAQVQAQGQAGVAHFDVVYQPLVPATWTGGAREALERGSLNFYLGAQVRVAGRYVVSGRVFDANDQPVALLQFNGEVPAGPAEFRLNLFGALLRDKSPAFPLKLVDVEGFLLQPDTFPDRAMMQRLSGLVHTSRRYAADSFSPAEWSSEERDRYLTEYGRDLQEAEDVLARLGR